MKKHIAGFALFCFIVGIAVLIGRTFGYFIPESKTSCWPKSERQTRKVIEEVETINGKIDKNAPRVRQAVFNMKTKQVNIELVFSNNPAAVDKNHIQLNYFRHDGRGARFIISESVTFVPASFVYKNNETTAFVISSYEWLDKFDSYENLYVTAEFPAFRDAGSLSRSSQRRADDYDSAQDVPKFDPDFAREISLFWGNSPKDEFIVDFNR